MNRFYRFGELKAQLQESANEFKPVFGKGVKGEKESNRKAYGDITKETSKYLKSPDNGDKANKNEMEPITRNGMSDLEYDSINDTYKENAKAGMEGFTSANDKKNHGKEALGNASRNDSKFVKQFTDQAKDKHERRNKESEVGLTSHLKDKEDVHLHNGGVVESKKIPLLKFKHVQFISESQMMAHIPDDYKCEGKRFFMQDHKDNKYLVEWHDKPEIKKMLNETKTKSEMDRIKYLFNYTSKESNTNGSMRINEEKVDTMLGKVRDLMK